MKVLIIDSHKGGKKMSDNLHLLNASYIAEALKADLIWSYEGVNDDIKSDYDVIIFNHASHYSFVDYAWLEKSPNARLFHITNEYNLGEPRALWMAVKAGRKYDVIANHPHEPSKIVMKYVNNWNIVNLNALIYEEKTFDEVDRSGVVYHGSFRKDRIPYFAKYLKDGVTVSTHKKNIEKFTNEGVTANFVDRIKWSGDGMRKYSTSIYIEDQTTHKYYNHLANRFYESISWGVVPIFSEESSGTILESGYNVPKPLIVDSHEKLIKLNQSIEQSKEFRDVVLNRFKTKAAEERVSVLDKIKTIINGEQI